MAQIISLFLTFAKIGAFSIGGGYAMLPFIQKEVIENHAWMSIQEFSDILAISQMTPGPIAVNSATYVGYTVGGFWGSVAATLGVVLPSFIMILIIAMFFIKLYEKKTTKNVFKGIRPAVVGLIAAAAWSVTSEAIMDMNIWNAAASIMDKLKAFDIKAVLIFLASFASLFHKKVDPIYVIIASAVVGILIY